MTTPFRDIYVVDGSTKKGLRKEQPFSAWIRSESRLDSIVQRLSVSDCDYWIHQYRPRTDSVGEDMIDNIMLIELKSHSAGPPYSQRDTLRLVAEMLRKSCLNKRGHVVTQPMSFENGVVRRLKFYGIFLLQLSADRPDNSEEIVWRGKRVSLEMLIEVLSFERDPRTMRPRSERRHHLPGAFQRQPQLDLVVTA
jgi:hypothetical protein